MSTVFSTQIFWVWISSRYPIISIRWFCQIGELNKRFQMDINWNILGGIVRGKMVHYLESITQSVRV
ncbi:hypothetical protein [Paenibacillus sp. GSMTC-2017]|uniref:hypothetical protein n=1 Tax=Paenibacillus sp. GSMTC-2017 TaxID=2794350 RepID=UPI001E3958C3|nr:hypothetical protein [Paenibacillus sp. GSMTC-2017]